MGSVRTELATLKTPVAEHLEEHRVLARCARNRDPQVGFVLGEMQNFSAVNEHRACSLFRKELPRIHFADVCDQIGFDASRLLQELRQAAVTQAPEPPLRPPPLPRFAGRFLRAEPQGLPAIF